MTIQQMRYLLAVVYSGSISEAAKQLFTAQSSISASIRDLEDEIGFPIFQRNSRGVTLTKRGEDLVIDVRMIMEKIDLLEHKYTENTE